MELEIVVGTWMGLELLALLRDALGARDGDTLLVDANGIVGLGRTATPEASRLITAHLSRLPSAAAPAQRRAVGLGGRPSSLPGPHLRLER